MNRRGPCTLYCTLAVVCFLYSSFSSLHLARAQLVHCNVPDRTVLVQQNDLDPQRLSLVSFGKRSDSISVPGSVLPGALGQLVTNIAVAEDPALPATTARYGFAFFRSPITGQYGLQRIDMATLHVVDSSLVLSKGLEPRLIAYDPSVQRLAAVIAERGAQEGSYSLFLRQFDADTMALLPGSFSLANQSSSSFTVTEPTWLRSNTGKIYVGVRRSYGSNFGNYFVWKFDSAKLQQAGELSFITGPVVGPAGFAVHRDTYVHLFWQSNVEPAIHRLEIFNLTTMSLSHNVDLHANLSRLLSPQFTISSDGLFIYLAGRSADDHTNRLLIFARSWIKDMQFAERFQYIANYDAGQDSSTPSSSCLIGNDVVVVYGNPQDSDTSGPQLFVHYQASDPYNSSPRTVSVFHLRNTSPYIGTSAAFESSGAPSRSNFVFALGWAFFAVVLSLFL